jgi:hypothetical protein
MLMALLKSDRTPAEAKKAAATGARAAQRRRRRAGTGRSVAAVQPLRGGRFGVVDFGVVDFCAAIPFAGCGLTVFFYRIKYFLIAATRGGSKCAMSLLLL